MSEPLFITPEGTDRLIGLALDGLASPHTRRAYQAALDEFLTWSQGQQPSELCKALVNRYKSMLFEKELAPATINLRLAAVRRLAQEMADNGLLDASVASTISKVHGLRLYGVRIGRWLTSAGARLEEGGVAATAVPGTDRAGDAVYGGGGTGSTSDALARSDRPMPAGSGWHGSGPARGRSAAEGGARLRSDGGKHHERPEADV